MIAFVYSWHDKLTNKHYIGSHKGNLDDGYICSSKIMLIEYIQRPSDFERTILSKHKTYSDALEAEVALLRSIDARNNPMYYNQHNGDGKFKTKGPLLESTKAKLSESLRGRKVSLETRQQLSIANIGKKHSSEHKEKIRQTLLGKKRPVEVCEKIKQSRIGMKFTQEHKEKLRAAWIKRKERESNG